MFTQLKEEVGFKPSRLILKDPQYHDRIVLKNGGVIEREDGTNILEVNAAGTTTTLTGTETVVASEITLAEGNLLVGNNSGVGVALNAKTSNQVLVGNGTTLTSVAVSGDLTNSAGVFTIAADAVNSSKLDETTIQYAEVSLSKVNLLALSSTPITVVAAPGAGKAVEFLSAVLINDFDTAAYTGGGAVTIQYTGGSAISSAVSAGNSFGAASDKITQCVALDTANGIPMSANTALTIAAAADFTDPGTAAGVGRVKVAYRVHTTGL